MSGRGLLVDLAIFGSDGLCDEFERFFDQSIYCWLMQNSTMARRNELMKELLKIVESRKTRHFISRTKGAGGKRGGR